MAKRNAKSLSNSSEVLQGLFESGKSPLSEQFLRWKLWKMWPEFVGPSISAISEPVGYRRGTLYVFVQNSSWMQQLFFMVDPMRAKINQRLGLNYVRTIQLTLDRRTVPSDSKVQEELKNSIEKLMPPEQDFD